jgi:hypothetical protein
LPILTICTGETATLTPAIQIGQNLWFTAASGGTLLSTSPSYTTPVLGTAGTYRYYLEVVDGNGCASATRTEGQVWVVNPVVPPPPITGPTSVCSNSSHSYSIPAIPNVTYTWSGLPTGASITQGQGTNQIEINWGAARSGSYTLVVVPNYPCGPGASQQVVIQVSEPPARPLAITGPSQLCIGSTATYNVTTRPGETYTWSLNPPGPTLTPIVGPSTTITWNTAGIYALEVQAQNQCGTSPRQSLAVWIATPAVADGGPDATTCGTTAILQAVAPPLPSTGRWRFVAGPVNPTFTQSGTRAIVFGLSAAGVYEFDWEVDNGACPPTSARVRITKRVAPVQPTILTPFQAQCNQETGQIGFIQPTDGTGVWSFMTGPVVAAIDNGGSVIGMTAPGRYRFRYTVSNTCGSSFAEAEIVRENPASTPFAGADQVVCENPFALLIGSLPPDGYTGKWEYINGPALANVATFGRYGSVVNMSAAGIYTFRYSLISISGICPTVSDVVRVTRVNAPTQPFITGPTQVCGTSAVLRGNIPQVGTPSWSFISGPVTPVINPQNETITITDLTVPGRYTFRWTVESPPCQPLAYDHTIEVSPGTQGGLVQGGGTFCGTQNSGNLLLSGYAGEILGWEIADNPGFGGATLTANTSDIQGFTNLTQTTYFRALVKQGSCPAAYSTTAIVEVLPATVSVNAGPDLTICGSSVALNATVSPANANLTWSIVSQPNAGSASLNPSGATATLTDLASGETVILVEASNACATGSDVVRIRATNNIVAGTLTGDATVCAGQHGGTLNLTGSNGQILRWESSTNGWFTVNTILNTTPAQPFGNLTQTTSFRAVLGGVGCPPLNSNEVTVVVNPQPVANAGPDQAVCTDNFVLVGNPVPNATLTWTQVGGPVTLTPPVNTRILTLSNVTTSGTYTFKYTVTVPGCPPAVDYVNVTVGAGANVGTVTGNATFCGNSGSGTLTLTGFIGSVVRWESSTNNWQTITQHNNPTPSFTYFNLTQTTQFRAVVQVPGCPQAVSNHATVVVNQPPTVAQAPARLDICTDNVQLIGNAPLVGTGEWKFIFGPAIPTVTGNGSFAFVTGLTATGSYLFEYEIRNDPCPKSVAQTIVTVSQPVAVGPLTANQSVCAGANSGLLTLAQPAGTVLYWETSPDNFVNITTVARTTTAFPFSNLTATTSFRAVVRNGGCAPLTSNAVTVTVFQPTQSGVITGATTVCSNGNTGTLNLVGNVGDVVEWQVSTDNITYTPVANTTTSLTYTNLTQTTWYRVRVKNGPCSEAISAPVRIQVDQLPVGGTAAANATVCQGSNFGTLTLTGHTGTVLRWEFSENGIDYNPILNPTTSQSYQNLINSRQYRAVLGNGVCPEVLSSIVFITVNAPPTPGTITAPATVCAGTNAGSLTLNGNSAGVLRWESTTDGFTFTTIAHTGQTLNWLNLTQTTQYRAVVSDGICPPVPSPLVEITVDQPPVGGVVGADQTVCISNPTGLLTLSGAVGNVRRWEQSTDGGVSWTPIAHTATSYAFANLTTTTQFRAVVGRGVCPDAVSAAARVQVDPLTVAGTLAGAESSCSTPITRTLSLTGNVGDVVAWQSSTDGVNFTNLVGTGNSIEYTTTPQRTWYRAIVRSGVCDPETTATVSVQIFTPSVGGTLTASPAQVCFAQNNGAVSLTGHTGDIVRWERSTDGGITWTTIANTTATQVFSDLSQTTQYRVVVQNGVCAPAFSTVATVAVFPALQFTSSEVSGCSGLNNLQVTATNAALPVTYSIVPAVAAANQSGLFQNLATGTYTVTAIDANGCTGSVQVTLTGQQTTAQLTSITNVTQSSATVQWLPVPGALTYTLRYRIVGSTDWTVLPNLTTAFRLITGLQQNSTYEIEVAYRCPAASLSPFSTGPVRNFTTLPLAATLCSSAAPISPPGGVYINQIGFNTARINWTGYADAAGYIVSWGIAFTNPSSWPQAVVCHPQQHFVLSGLTPGTTYQVRVRTNCTNCTTASQATDKRSDWTTLVNFSTNSFREAQADPAMPFALEVYPNPSQGQFWTRFSLANPEVVEVQLHDAAGREVSRLYWNLEAGEHQLPVSVETAGVYLLEVRIGTLRRFVKVIVQ